MWLSLPTRRQIAFSVVMGLVMTLSISGVLTAISGGLSVDFVRRWVCTFIVAFALAAPMIYFLGPRIRTLVEKWIN